MVNKKLLITFKFFLNPKQLTNHHKITSHRLKFRIWIDCWRMLQDLYQNCSISNRIVVAESPSQHQNGKYYELKQKKILKFSSIQILKISLNFRLFSLDAARCYKSQDKYLHLSNIHFLWEPKMKIVESVTHLRSLSHSNE